MLAVVLVLVARPIAVAVATLPFAYTWRERSILGWAGLRGAVPVVLATFPVIEHVPRSLQFFNIVFFAVLLSTIVQGSTFEPIARRLGVTRPEPVGPPNGVAVREESVLATRRADGPGRTRTCARRIMSPLL